MTEPRLTLADANLERALDALCQLDETVASIVAEFKRTAELCHDLEGAAQTRFVFIRGLSFNSILPVSLEREIEFEQCGIPRRLGMTFRLSDMQWNEDGAPYSATYRVKVDESWLQ